MKFIIFHGSFGSPEINWYIPLKEELASFGQEVWIPRLPVNTWDEITMVGPESTESTQNLDSWFSSFDANIPNAFKEGELCFVGHSIGCLFILHLLERYNIKLDSAIFVSPFLNKLNKSWQIDLVNESFYKSDFDFEKINKLVDISYSLYSDNDPYVDINDSLEFIEKTESLPILVRGGEHMNDESGFQSFPLVEELCKTRFGYSSQSIIL
ncbi:MAG: alpha/beta fold hydrolase [bacterium]